MRFDCNIFSKKDTSYQKNPYISGVKHTELKERLAATASYSQASQQDIIKERKATMKLSKAELNAKATKAAQKEAKALAKEGWTVSPGALPFDDFNQWLVKNRRADIDMQLIIKVIEITK